MEEDHGVVEGEADDRKEPSVLEDTELYLKMRQWFNVDDSHSREWRGKAKMAYDFVSGVGQWKPETKRKMESEDRVPITMNVVLPVIKAVAGIEVNTRHETIFLPRGMEEGDIVANESLTQASNWMGDGCGAKFQESQAFQDVLKTGMGWCLSGDANVRLPKLRFATVRNYSGRIVEVQLENGEKLTGTPNHPVLTDRGWQALGSLHKGDHLVSGAILERVDGLPVEDFDQVESRLQDKIDAFGAGREVGRFVTAADDFYADGVGSKVHIVYADSPLGRQFRHAARRKHIAHLGFVWRDCLEAGRALLAGLCAPLVAGRAAEGQLAVNVGHAPSLLLTRLYDAAKRVASATQSLAHCLAVEPNHFGDIVGGQFLDKVKALKLFNGNPRDAASVVAPKFVSGGLDAPFDGRVADAKLGRDFRDWKPVLKVEVQNLLRDGRALDGLLIGIKSIHYRHVEHFPVYDVGTTVGFFIAGNTITSNCEERLDYEIDPDGKYIEERLDPLEMWWDASARGQNLVDSRRRWRARKMNIADARAMFPDAMDQDLNCTWAMGVEGKEPKSIEDRRTKTDNSAAYDPKGEVTILQCQWWEREPYARVANPFTGQVESLSIKDHKALVKKAKEYETETGQAIPVESVNQTRRVYKQAFIGGKILKKGDCPRKDGFTLNCITGEPDHNTGTFMGIIDAMMDPQMMLNKWLSQATHIINTTAKGGILAEEDAFTDQREAEETYARPDAITWVKKGAIANGKIREKPGVGLAAPYLQLMQMAMDAMPRVTGINMELMGLRDAQQAGVLEAQRKQAAMTILATVFDSLQSFRIEVGKTRLSFIQNHLADGRLIRILRPDGGYKAVKLMKDRMVGEFDVVVSEAPQSPNNKEQTWAALQVVLPAFKNMLTPPVAVMLLEYVPGIPKQLVDGMRGLLEQQSQPTPEAEHAKMLGFQGQEAKIMRDQAAAEKDHATAQKTLAETALAAAEKHGQDILAAKHQIDTVGSIAKAVKTIDHIPAAEFAVAPMRNPEAALPPLQRLLPEGG